MSLPPDNTHPLHVPRVDSSFPLYRILNSTVRKRFQLLPNVVPVESAGAQFHDENIVTKLCSILATNLEGVRVLMDSSVETEGPSGLVKTPTNREEYGLHVINAEPPDAGSFNLEQVSAPVLLSDGETNISQSRCYTWNM